VFQNEGSVVRTRLSALEKAACLNSNGPDADLHGIGAEILFFYHPT
jgi:hypothetical protein